MNALKVVDASAIAALVFGEAEGEEIASQLQGVSLAAPDLLKYELANTCLKKFGKIQIGGISSWKRSGSRIA